MPDLPSGTVTFLFTDVEGSTEYLERAREAYTEALDAHRLILRSAAAETGGLEIDCRGEEFLFAFPRAKDGIGAALAAQAALGGGEWPQDVPLRVRMGLHTGDPISATMVTSGSTCTGALGSAPWPTAARFCSRSRRTTSLQSSSPLESRFAPWASID